jgi:hypothetical protein
MISRLALLILTVTFLTVGCGGKQPKFLMVTTTPDQARIFVGAEEIGMSPVTYDFERANRHFHKGSHTIKATRRGFQESYVRINREWWQNSRNWTYDARGRRGATIHLYLLRDDAAPPTP